MFVGPNRGERAGAGRPAPGAGSRPRVNGTRLRLLRRRLSRWMERKEWAGGWVVLVFAGLIGVGAGYAIVGFYGLVDLIGGLTGHVGPEASAPGIWWLPFLVIPAALFVARALRVWLAGAEDGSMVPAMMEAAARRGGDLPFVPTMARVLSAAVTLGAGGSLGSEGPLAVTGGALGSGLGRLFGFRPARVKVLLGCGAAAGIAASFNAPIAGVMFALEVVLGTFTVAALSPVVVASVTGAVVARAHLGRLPAFEVPTQFALGSVRELGLYAALGLACGLLAVGFVEGFQRARSALERLPFPWWSGPVAAGALVAAAGLFHPALLGPGRQGIHLVLFSQVAGTTALLLALLKIATAALTMGGGGAGGTVTPSLFVGAAFGSSFGMTVAGLFPELTVHPSAFAMVGMAGLLAGSTFAPLTALMMVFEMTDDYGLILPLMLVCVLSYVVARTLGGESIYTSTLAREGIRIRQGVDLSVLESVRVEEWVDRHPTVLREGDRMEEVLGHLRDSPQTDFPVVDAGGRLVGVVSYQQMARALAERELADLLVAADLMQEEVETVSPGNTLHEAMRKLEVRDLNQIPVVRREDSRELVGILGRSDVMRAYDAHLMLGR